MEKDADIKLATDNIKVLETNDVVLASYLGSGSSLLGGILIELAIDYIEGYQEKITKNKQNTDVILPMWRKHWQQLEEKYNKKYMELRVFKTHFYPASFENALPNKAILLVRDGRDAVISYYNWRKSFSNEIGSLDEFIVREGYYGKKPFDDWSCYINEWLNWGKNKNIHIVKYEDLKFSPMKAIKELLVYLNITRTEKEILKSIKNTKFSKIKKEEINFVKNKNSPIIFRKGLVGEWRGTLSNKALKNIVGSTYDNFCKFNYITKNNNNYCTETYILPENETIENPTVKVINEPFDVRYLDCICGKTYIKSYNEEVQRSVQYICELNGWECKII